MGSRGRFGHRQSSSSEQKWSSNVRVRHLLKRSEDHWQELDQDPAEVPRLGVRLLLPNCKVARSHTALGHTPILQHPPTGPAHCSLFGNRPIRVMEVLGGFHSLHLTSSRYRHHLLCKQRSKRRVVEPALMRYEIEKGLRAERERFIPRHNDVKICSQNHCASQLVRLEEQHGVLLPGAPFCKV